MSFVPTTWSSGIGYRTNVSSTESSARSYSSGHRLRTSLTERHRAASATSLSRNAARNGGEPFIVIWRSSRSIPSFATYTRVCG